ncbi:MAG: Cas9 inhibitor AcrIIA9 family protein [Christensenellales bacterium]
MKIKLEAQNAYETAVLKYLEENASDALVEKINNGTKTLEQCFAYIRKQAQKEAKNGCAMIEDKVVYGWAVHFFEEDEIEAEVKGKPTPTPEPKEIVKKTETKKKTVKTDEKKEEQLSLFALLR